MTTITPTLPDIQLQTVSINAPTPALTVTPLTHKEPILLKRPIYIDYNATTPIDKQILQELPAIASTVFGNPSSTYAYGIQAKSLLDTARKQVLTALHSTGDGICIFTSCATESINLAIVGTVEQYRHTHNTIPHIITTATEHIAVLDTVQYLTQYNYCTCTILPVNQYGCVDIDTLKHAITDSTILVSIILANNEIGSINNIQQLCSAVKSINTNVLFHTDASQAIGKHTVDVQQLNVDLLTIAGHKFYTFKGIGALYIKNHAVMQQVQRIQHGAAQEFGLRAGTENIVMNWSLGYGITIAVEQLQQNINHMSEMINLLYTTIHSSINGWVSHYKTQQYISSVLYMQNNFAYIKLQDTDAVPLIRMNSSNTDTLCNTLSISFAHINATELLHQIQQDICASAGAACHSDKHNTISHVLQAINLPEYYALGTIRLSTGKYNTAEEMSECAKIIAQTVISMLVTQYCKKPAV